MLESISESIRVHGCRPAVVSLGDRHTNFEAYRRLIQVLEQHGYLRVTTGWLMRTSVSEASHKSSVHIGTDKHKLDFMEIGTSDFDTLSHAAARKLPAALGLSVELMPAYLARLPVLPHVHKINAAVVDFETAALGSVVVWYVDEADIKTHRLPSWLKGCNQVGSPSKDALRELHRRGLSTLMKNASVRARTFESILSEYEVRSLRLLKLDVEGQEAPILSGVLRACERRATACPQAIVWETTHTHSSTRARLHTELLRNGYMWARPWKARDAYYVRTLRLGLPHRLSDRDL